MALIPFVLLSSSIFTGIIILLIIILSVVEAKVVKKGNCEILINDNKEKSIVTSTGKNLLTTLANNKIFLPSASAGGGACAMCKCQVLEGGGHILSTETGLLTRKEQKQNYRLACQVKVRNDVKISIPEEIFDIKKFECTVRSNNNVATFIKELVLNVPEEHALDFKAGGYIQIDVPEYNVKFSEFNIQKKYHPDWNKYKLWDLNAENDEEAFRAYSMASYPAEKEVIMLNVRIATPPPNKWSVAPGIASSYIFNLNPGDKVTVSGPYGEFFIKETEREMLYIGGGAGMAPMRSHLFHLFHTLKTKRKVSFWYGARSKCEMFYDNDFKNVVKDFPNFSYNVGLSDPLPEDNWSGLIGFIHQCVYENYLKDHEEPEEIEYYLCGPPVMIDAVEEMLDSLGVPPEMIMFDKF